MEKEKLLRELFPILEIHNEITIEDMAKKLSEEHTEFLNFTDDNNRLDELVDILRAGTGLLLKMCKEKNRSVHHVIMKNEHKVLKKYKLAR